MTGRSQSRRAFYSLWIAGLVGIGFGCAGRDIRQESIHLEREILKARRNGAYGCSPKSLALAEAHLERTRDELDIGNYREANKHRDLARRYTAETIKNSPAERCAQPKSKTQDSDGDGIVDEDDQCPFEAEDKDGFEDEDGCPDNDNDGDGLADESDACPLEAEDKDGFEDEDGCPDNDNDGDRIFDANDQCPGRAEDYDGFEDEDGCPDNYKLVVVTEKKIELKQKIYFETAKATIRAISFAILDEISQVMQDRPALHVRVEGHTDSRGSKRRNLALSTARAQSVREFLMSRGVAAERLESVGFGESNPIASNRTRSGRASNRRVEFLIVKH